MLPNPQISAALITFTEIKGNSYLLKFLKEYFILCSDSIWFLM